MISGEAAAGGILRDYCGNILFGYAEDIGNCDAEFGQFTLVFLLLGNVASRRLL